MLSIPPCLSGICALHLGTFSSKPLSSLLCSEPKLQSYCWADMAPLSWTPLPKLGGPWPSGRLWGQVSLPPNLGSTCSWVASSLSASTFSAVKWEKQCILWAGSNLDPHSMGLSTLTMCGVTSKVKDLNVDYFCKFHKTHGHVNIPGKASWKPVKILDI